MNNPSDVKIPGKAIASSIEMMAALGPLGERVLREHGIDVIDPNKKYPGKIRTAIFDEVSSRFGNEALLAFGFENYARYPEFVKLTKRFREENGHRLRNPNYHKKNIELLGELMMATEKVLDSVLSRNFKSQTRAASVRVDKLSSTVFQIDTITALNMNHSAFIRGAWMLMLMECIGDIYHLEFDLMSEKSRSIDNGWVNFVYLLRFTPHEKLHNVEELTAREKFKANDALLRSVLLDAERQKEQIAELSSHLGKYLPPQIHKALFAGNYDTGITTRRKKLTIFFSDIANFTSISEGLQPEDLTKYLNEYFSEMTTIALDRGATIDKYIGDAMMVFFGDPETKGEHEDARACVEMALQMQDRMAQLQEKWRNEGFADPFQVRMGMNTGYCNVGNFGSDQRLTYTIIGGEVNVAQRLEANAESNGILMSYETYAHAQDIIDVEELDSIKMKGINREIKIFSVKNRKSIMGALDQTKPEEALEVKSDTIDYPYKHLPALPNRIANIEKQIADLAEQMSRLIKEDKNN